MSLTDPFMPPLPGSLAAQLKSAHYHDLLLPGTPVADALWADGTHADALADLAQDSSQTLRVRFFALELYRVRTGAFPDGCAVADVIPLYVYALANTPWEGSDLGVSGNDWGFWAYLDDQGHEGAGGLGQRVLALGEAVIPHLRPFLMDSRPVTFAGSRDATTGKMLAYQVRDVAAYLILRLRGEARGYVRERAARDAAIAELMARLGN
jgi:hypothetical protein